jgi:hypothetical protein
MDQSTRPFDIAPPRLPWANAVSYALSPPIVWALLAFPIAFHRTDDERALLWALLYGTLVCLLPVIYIAWNVRNGNISDLHMKERRERVRPFLVTLLGTLTALVALTVAGAPPLMSIFALFTLIQIGLTAVITLAWQISIHEVSISSAAVAMGVLYGVIPALILLPFVALVGMARYRLERHTMSQIVAGAALGASVSLLLIFVV